MTVDNNSGTLGGSPSPPAKDSREQARTRPRDNSNRTPRGEHVGELRLRRFRLGELAGPDRDEITRHTNDCGACRARLKTLDDEQRQFERDIPFERFAGGVERARRVPRTLPRRAWTVGAVGFAAAAALLLVLRPGGDRRGSINGFDDGFNRIKGTAAEVRIAAADGAQRAAVAGTTAALRPGDRVRLGFRTPRSAHLVAVSIDDAGTVIPLYPEDGAALPVEARRELTYLPDSLEFTGHGRERVFLLLADRPLAVGDVEKAARAAHARAKGDLRTLSAVTVEGPGKVEQFTWLFEKP